MRFSAQLLRNGKIVSDKVTGEIQIDPSGMGNVWKGHFTLPAGVVIERELYDLELDDGRACRIRVQGFYISGGHGLVFFDGCGSLGDPPSGQSTQS